ncbi:MAG: hypothetical protein PVF45_05420, partial [Anaerolineae bacterium]
ENAHHGVHLLAGGDDVEDMTMTLYAYPSPDGQVRTMLVGKVRADVPLTPGVSSAEDKLLDALDLGATKTMQVTETVMRDGRLPLDRDKELYENLVKAAKSIAYHFKAGGDGAVAAHVEVEIALVTEALDEAEQQLKDQLSAGDHVSGEAAELEALVPDDDPLVKSRAAMLAHYRTHLDDLKACLEKTQDWDGAAIKPEFVTAFTGKYQDEVVKTVVVPSTEGEGLPVVKEKDRSPNVQDGQWDGTWRHSPGAGTLYRIDLGDGWEAVYCPHRGQAQKEGAVFALQGTLVIAPPAGHADPAEAIWRMRQLNLHGYLASQEDEEYVYLNRQAWATRAAITPEYRQIMTWKPEENDRVGTLVTGAVGVLSADVGDEARRLQLAQEVLLRAQHRVKLERREALRDLVAAKVGLKPEELAAHPGYMQSTGGCSLSGKPGGFRVWHRLDAPPAHPQRRIVHQITGHADNLVAAVENGGVLYSTYRRRTTGIVAQGGTMSPDSDMKTGGAAYLFTRVRPATFNPGGASIIWDFDDLARRSDWFGYSGDHFGAINPKSGKYSAQWTTDPGTAAAFMGGSNEVMFKNGVSLLDYPPRTIKAGSQARRKKLLAAFEKQGVTHLGERSVEEIVVV